METAAEGRKSGLCHYAASPDADMREAYAQLPPSIQAIVKRYASDEVLTTAQLRHLGNVAARDRCEALQMLYKGSPVAEVVYFLLLSSAPSSTRASTETVAANPGGLPTADHAGHDDVATAEKENANSAATAPIPQKSEAAVTGPALRARGSTNQRTTTTAAAPHPAKGTPLATKRLAAGVVTSTKNAAPTRPATAAAASSTGGRGESVSTFITVSPISSEDDEDSPIGVVPATATTPPKTAGTGPAPFTDASPLSDASPAEISRGLSYSSAYLPATKVSSRRQTQELPHTATAPTPSESPAPVAVVIPNLSLHRVVGVAAVTASAGATNDAVAAPRATSPSLRPPENARRIVQYVDAKPKHAHREATATTATPTTTASATTATAIATPTTTEAVDLGSDPRAQALLDLYRRNVLKNELELEKAYTELSYQRSSVSPCAPPPGGMDWKAFLAHVRQKVRVAEQQQQQQQCAPLASARQSGTGAVYAVKRTSGGGDGGKSGCVASPRDRPGRISRGTDKTVTPHGTPRGTPRGMVTNTNTNTPNTHSSQTQGSPRDARTRRRRIGAGVGPRAGMVVAPPQKPCSAWDPVRGVYITHPNQLNDDPFRSARFQPTRSNACMDPAPQLQPGHTGKTKRDKKTRSGFCRSQTTGCATARGAYPDAPTALRRTNTRTQLATAGQPAQRFERAATATATFARTPSAPCGFTRTASATAMGFTRLHSINCGAGLLMSPRPATGRTAAAPAAAPPSHAPQFDARPERLQRTPSRWERPVETTPMVPTARNPQPRSARPRTTSASAAVVHRRPVTPRGQVHTAAAAAAAASKTTVFERLTSNFYPCTTAHSNNNYTWRSGVQGAGSPSASATAHTRATKTQTAVFQRTASKAAFAGEPEPTPELCSPRPTAWQSPQASRLIPSGSTRATTAALVSPISTPRSASHRKPAPVIEVRKVQETASGTPSLPSRSIVM